MIAEDRQHGQVIERNMRKSIYSTYTMDWRYLILRTALFMGHFRHVQLDGSMFMFFLVSPAVVAELRTVAR